MTAVIDRSAKLEGTPGGSLYIKPSQMDWKPTRFDKISIKVLYEDAGKGEIEQSFVLEGSVEDHDGVAVAGDYIWRKPGSLHENWSPNGAVLLAVYRKPNIYYDAGRETAGF